MPINKSTTIFWFYYRIATMSDCLTIIYLSSDTDVLLASESQTPKLNCGLYEMYMRKFCTQLKISNVREVSVCSKVLFMPVYW